MKTILIISLSFIIGLATNKPVQAENHEKNAAHSRTKSDLARDKASKPLQIMDFIGVKEGDDVLDFLGGGGYYSQLLAERVGSQGSVVLQTNQAYMKFVGKALEERSANGGLAHVTRLLSEADDLKLGEAKFDSAILVLGYHDFFFKDDGWDFPADKVIPQLRKSLKKGGRLLIIDHSAAKDAGIIVTKTLHRIEGAYVKKDLTQRGFKFVKQSDILSNDKDARDLNVFEPKMRRNTDRFVYLFEKE